MQTSKSNAEQLFGAVEFAFLFVGEVGIGEADLVYKALCISRTGNTR